ncbi:hypothetical protein [Chelativorans xinjiangense]|uniref:hypothetical protein n=1 Tax=Chelativorans xinjiangense TaxID=2681485 RepID=UPI001358ECB9|nr:hypothetical protein [Chelativorans xinjiangense]
MSRHFPVTDPFRFRPEHRPGADGEEDWADNRLSNFMAWAAAHALPRWCAVESHWTVRMTELLWADCPCCLGFRFMTIGAAGGFALGLLIGIFVN